MNVNAYELKQSEGHSTMNIISENVTAILGFPNISIIKTFLRKCGVGVCVQKLTSSGLSMLFQQDIKQLPPAPRTDSLYQKCNRSLYKKSTVIVSIVKS